jgi:hypothetical protein
MIELIIPKDGESETMQRNQSDEPFTILEFTSIVLIQRLTPRVEVIDGFHSFLINLVMILDLPVAESPMRITTNMRVTREERKRKQEEVLDKSKEISLLRTQS